ncbi:hypothetical protein N0V88_006297 [Collariella sp. IMI 366227]|nr:hypothetical protein N0V88_006297 [Collariella sp. IMI 366227]
MDKYEQFFPGLVQRPARTPTISRSPQIFDASLSIIRCRLKADDDYATTRSRELIEGFLRMLNNSLNISRSSLVFGWKYLYHHFYVQRDNWYTGRLLQYKGFANDIFDGFKWEPQDSQSNMQKPFVEDSLLPDLRRRFLRYKDFIYNKVPEKTRTDVMRSVYTLQDWTDEYDSLEEDYRELKRQVDRFKSNPELVVDYVREKQPYRLG